MESAWNRKFISDLENQKENACPQTCPPTSLPEIRPSSSSQAATPTWRDVLPHAIARTPRTTGPQGGGAVSSCKLLTRTGPQPAVPVQPDGCSWAEPACTASSLPSPGLGANLSHPCSSVPHVPAPALHLHYCLQCFTLRLQNSACHGRASASQQAAAATFGHSNRPITIWNQIPTNKDRGTLLLPQKEELLI